MMNDNKKVYNDEGKRVKDDVVDKYIDGWYEGMIKEVDEGIEDVIEEEEEEDFQRNVCQVCKERYSVFVYDGVMCCFRCAEKEIGEDKRRRELYRRVMVELVWEISILAYWMKCRECGEFVEVWYWREYDTYVCQECRVKW